MPVAAKNVTSILQLRGQHYHQGNFIEKKKMVIILFNVAKCLQR